MNNRILLLCTILFGLLSFFSNAAPTDIYSSDDEKPYVVLMKKPKSVEKLLMQKDFLASNSQLRQKITSFYSFGDFEGFSGVFNRYTLRGFWRNSLVEDIVPDSTFRAVDIERQTEAPSHLVRLTQPGPVFQEKDQRNYFFDNSSVGQNTIVYVIDTGVFIEHPEFEGRAVNGPNFSTDKENKDTVGHGTHVAGIIGAKTYGVAKQATIVSIKVLDKNGSGTLSSIITGLQYAVNHRNGLGEDVPAVVNLSLGAPKSAVVNRAIRAASNSGLFVVAAAGNNNANACSISPASSEFSFTVGAINDRTDRMASFTNWGKCVDIFAPGVNVESLSNLESNINNTRILSGTSMSSPVAAGVASVLFSRNVTFENMKDEILGLAHRDKIPLINFLLKPKSPNKILSTGITSDDYHGPDIVDDIDDDKNGFNATDSIMQM